MQSDHPSIAGLIFAVIGVGAVMLGRDPNGLANRLFSVGRWLQGQIAPKLRERLPVLPGSGGSADASPSGLELVETEPREVPAHAAT
jgi:branched-chain amino acid transport system permease protein